MIDKEFKDMLENKDEIIYIMGNRIEEDVAVCYDRQGYILLKIGDLDMVENYYRTAKNEYLSGGTLDIYKEMANNLEYLILPKNQELIDRIFNNTGYLGVYIENINKIIALGEN